MHPLIRAVAAVALLGSLSFVAGWKTSIRTVTLVKAIDGDQEVLSSFCPAGFLPDSLGCVPFPEHGMQEDGMGQEVGAHRDRLGQWTVYDQIPRRPDRPEDYGAYLYPVEGAPVVVSPYDLDQPDAVQRRGKGFSATGHGGIDLSLPRGTPVRAMKLSGQRGATEVVFVGRLFGNTVVTRHTLEEGGRERDYLLIHGHLDEVGGGLGSGATVGDGAILGTVGDSGSEGRVHLHLEVRQVREGVERSLLRTSSLVDRKLSIVCDPRNVLPFGKGKGE